MDISNEKLKKAIDTESQKFALFYQWLENHMPPSFFEEIDEKALILITHNLMELDLQNYFSHIYIEKGAFSLCLDSPDADLKILKQHQTKRIKNYRSFVSNIPIPFANATAALRIAVISFSTIDEAKSPNPELLSHDSKENLFLQMKERNPEVNKEEFYNLLEQLNSRFLRALPPERLLLALDMFFRAKQRDNCQYEVRYQEGWKKTETPSMQIIFAWKGVSKRNFLYRLAKVIKRHHLALKRVNAIYINPYSKDSILLMSIALHGENGKAAWEEADLDDLFKELVTLKYFEGMDRIERVYVDSGLLTGNQGNLIKTMTYFIHQALVHYDIHAYAFSFIEESLSRYPELLSLLIESFGHKFHPQKTNVAEHKKTLESFLHKVNLIESGNEVNDTRDKNVLLQAANFVTHALKTNFYRNNKTAFCFRLDPRYLEKMPYPIEEKFPVMPFAIYFMKGFHFLGFHIRFKDLARGGLRTVMPKNQEAMVSDRNNVFAECYNLGYTQQKKNKDIPEGGAKAVIFLEPFDSLKEEISYQRDEFLKENLPIDEIEKKLESFSSIQKLEHLYQAQRAFIESLVPLINCNSDGTLKAKHIVDYWKQPEYIYLGPDENMHNSMITWIANYSKQKEYKPGIAFISSKPELGFNHKQLGVTSLGVNVYMDEMLKYLGIDPTKDIFTLKMTGGPDGDVAGNQMLNLYRFYPKTAKLLTTIDISGTIFDPQGLDLEEVKNLFLKQKPIAEYPPHKLSPGGFLLDTRVKQEGKTLLWKNTNGTLTKQWLSTNDTNHILRHTVHKTETDIFVTGGGRPKTLSEKNVTDFLLDSGKPSSKAIVEGANLYLTQEARRTLEKMGVLIIKDSSANKGGVICSSSEVLANLCLKEDEFLKEKSNLTKEILALVAQKAKQEASLLFTTHSKTKEFLTDISEKISKEINNYMYAILDVLEKKPLSQDATDPLNQVLQDYCLPTLKEKYAERIFKEIPEIHKKAIIACHLSSQLIYQKGLSEENDPMNFEEILKFLQK